MHLDDPPYSLADPPGGTSFLVVGPPMTGKYQLLLEVLATAERAILVSTGEPADRVREDFAGVGDPGALSVVDCVSRERGADAPDIDRVKYAATPQNLTDVGVKFTELAEAYQAESDATAAVGVHSLSQILMYWDAERVYRFARVLVGQVSNAGWVTVATLNGSAHDEQTLHTLYEPFDAIVETREADGERQCRMRTRRADPTPWTSF